MKKQGKLSLKKHYFIFVAACLIAAFLSAEFRSSMNFSSAQSYERIYEQIENDMSGAGGYTVKSNTRSIGWEDVLRIIAEDNTQAGKEMADQIKENAIEHADQGNPAFGRTRGVFSSIVNQVTSGSIIVTAVAAIASVTGSENVGVMILIVLGALLMFSFWFLIQNTFSVVMRRVFMEGILYKRVTAQRFLFLLRIKKWLKAARTMFVKYVLYSLWCLTIVGIAVKHYSYYPVSYIVAENPDMTARQAITLSRRMMKGHKWECFVFEVTFIGWEILGILTMGIFNVFFTNPYKTAAFTQYYAALRAEAKAKNIPDAELLYDTYLYEKPEEALLKERYADVISVVENAPGEENGLSGWRGFLARNFGVILLRREEDREYERRQAEIVKVYELIDDTQGEAYPVRFYPTPEENRRKLVESLNYMRHYSVWSLVVLFLGLSFFGWLWEVGMHLVSYGNFVNRGALHGPWLPIYGTGSVLILTLLYRLRWNPALEFIATIVVCGFLEYMTSLVMEIVTGGMKWWDYSGYFLNLNGRICAEGLLVFGIGGLAITYAIAPMVDNLISGLNEKRLKIICTVLMAVFFMDAVYSQIHPNAGKGVTDISASFSSPRPETENNQDDAVTVCIQTGSHCRQRSGS